MFNTGARNYVNRLYASRSHVELTVGVLKDGMTKIKHFGPDGKEKEEKLTYPVGSIGKTITAALLAKRVEEGKIDLHKSLCDYIPGLPKRYYPNLLRLATHHSGYFIQPLTFTEMLKSQLRQHKEDGMFRKNPFHGHTMDKEFIPILTQTKLKDKPYKYRYSNFGFSVLAYILGRIEGSDYYTVIEPYIRKELGLSDTGYGDISLTGYDKKDRPCRPWLWDKNDIITPAGGIYSSIEDLLAYAQKHLDGSLPYVAQCHKRLADGQKDFSQGLAWHLKNGTEISYHEGLAGAFSSVLAIDLKKKCAVAIGLNYGMVFLEKLAFIMLEDMHL
ncbi:beta-lactamase family protein [Treponema sp. OMZ 840]|uniref:serine hydrolase domain-containing protein n=1 Tax=Treponema sp. OMZ 840 TaxID=244313 RepID=UPI003D92CEF7